MLNEAHAGRVVIFEGVGDEDGPLDGRQVVLRGHAVGVSRQGIRRDDVATVEQCGHVHAAVDIREACEDKDVGLRGQANRMKRQET